MSTAYESAPRSPAMQRLLEDLEAERYRPVPPPPAPTPDELAARARILAVLSERTGEAP
jgi:hypothetical protein